ncbi:Tripeptidyl aminopeptidase [Kordia antarctica]|uniref:Tripeptidyl aminopeptidase n=1 Tax=Kordia antarctica TaxID=1218801 RepID=A0A7L4ZFI9_9FLAO|nr:alpha/beta fold hydrolase [Kordia antarctica]QHI35433.1 Tripeptidyl aminopeptidase [Kordia antarctica]
MILIKRLFVLIGIFFLGFLPPLTAQNSVSFEEAKSFYPYAKVLKNDSIIWGYLSVPENWEKEDTNTIKIGVTVLKSRENKEDVPAVVFIQGGPGASGVSNIWSWRLHPLRKTHDIVLFDVRGTGFSKPRLCPNLGEEFLKILAKNQSEVEDEKQKVNAALACKQELIRKGIDTDAYHSGSVAKDLHALMSNLGYKGWSVYGVSYGTYMAQVYASIYPEDVTSLVLDSSIADIKAYYTENTSNYMNSLNKVFDACKNDPNCNQQYPNLEETYYEVINEMENNPITVPVSKNFIEGESFTFNSEDFKVAIQQALYNKQLVEVIPLLIHQFKDKNKDALGNLVTAFSSLLMMDYGVYYCVSCNETLPNNELSNFELNVSKYDKLHGGLAFYKSDFKVCDKWNINKPDSLFKNFDLDPLKEENFPVLIFSGEYDPITPDTNGEKVAERFNTAHNIPGSTYGHVPGFTGIGKSVATSFIKNPNQKPDVMAFKKVVKMEIVKDITVNKGVAKMGNSLNEMNLIFLAPLVIAISVMLVFILVYSFKIFRKKYNNLSDNLVRGLSILSSTLGLICLIGLVGALLKVTEHNYFILAFGLPQNYAYLFTLSIVFLVLVILTALVFLIRIKKISNRSIVFSVIFSNILLATYMIYWGIFPF